MSRNKKVCFVTPSLEKGGMERVLVELANYGVNKGLKVHIITLLSNKEIAYPLDTEVNYIQPPFEYKKDLFFKVKVFFYLLKTLKYLKPDACLSFSETFNPLSILASRFVGYPIFISDRSNPLKTVSFLKRLIKNTLYPLATGVIAQTNFAKEIFSNKKLNKNIITVPNPLRDVAVKDLKMEPSNNIIVSVGRLIPSKNFSQLIDIFSKTNYFDWELWIIGEGGDRTNLINKIKVLGLENHVKLKGQVNDVDKYLCQASIFAFTSLSEGFPNALSEAMAIPLACIAFNCPAGPEDIIIDNQNGYLVPLDKEDLYIEKLQLLMDDKTLRDRFARHAFRNRERFSPDLTSEKYFKFILSK